LLVVGGFQYLLNSYIDNNTQSNVIESTLITLLIVVIVVCMVSVSVGLGLSWVRFGWDEVGKLGHVDKC
jgi:membrane protein insertase Oxa1/YidC/SpoIIIJ